MENRCMYCGEVIPEGRQICPSCEKSIIKKSMILQSYQTTNKKILEKKEIRMEEKTTSEAISEIKGATEEELRKVIEKWFESVRNSGMKIGASYIAAAVYGIIEKDLKKEPKPSLRDYQRTIKKIIKIVSVQLKQEETQQNDLFEA